jgi:predicted ATPase
MPRNFDAKKPTLAQVRLKNFKSVARSTVDLGPLTVVVGKNSSGKSTLLQAVMVLSQAIRSRSRTGQFPFNGDFVRLGTFNEVKNFNHAEDVSDIQIGFTFRRQQGRFHGAASRRGIQDPDSQTIIRWDGHLSPPQEMSSGFGSIDALEMQVVSETGDETKELYSVDIAKQESSDQSRYVEITTFGRRRSGDNALRVDGRIRFEDGRTSSINIATIYGGLPRGLYRDDTRLNNYAKRWWDQYLGVLEHEHDEAKKWVAEAKQNQTKPRGIREAVKQAAEDIQLSVIARTDESTDLPPELADEFFFALRAGRLTDKQKQAVIRSMEYLQEATFRNELRKELKEPSWNTIEQSEVEDLQEFNSAVQNFFIRDVRYLGPLRQQPQVLYSPGPDRDDLGIHGEFTAGVLHDRSQSRRKELFPFPGGVEIRSTTVEALTAWLQELELVDQAKATDRGRLGIGLEVSPRGSSQSVDLTSVGVGVSQALPVVLLCLLAKPGSLVVIEQPELHLHPAMQLKLADFFLACARSGRQILIETHSEHLVNRLRLRTVEDPEGSGSLVRLLFAEQENGDTVYRSSKVNNLGGLDEDWPNGFLDVGTDEAAEMMRRVLERLRKENS